MKCKGTLSALAFASVRSNATTRLLRQQRAHQASISAREPEALEESLGCEERVVQVFDCKRDLLRRRCLEVAGVRQQATQAARSESASGYHSSRERSVLRGSSWAPT